MLLYIVQTYSRDHWTYALQTVQVDVRGTTRRTLLLEYLLVNTWTYEVAFGWIARRRPQDVCPFGWTSTTLPGELLVALSYKYPLPLHSSSLVFRCP
jgi:hypothetical protein